MLQKPHGNLQIKRTYVAFHRRLGFLSPPDLNSTPWDKPKVAEKDPQPWISPRVCTTEAGARCPGTLRSGTTFSRSRPTQTAPGVDTGRVPLFGAPVVRRVVRAPGRCQSVWKPAATQMKASATGKATRRRLSELFLKLKSVLRARRPAARPSETGSPKSSRRRAARPVSEPNVLARCLPAGPGSPRSQHGLARRLHSGALPSAPRGPGR